jgi:TP901 family phage tail tape measure protein
MKFMADGSQFFTEQGKIAAAMNTAAGQAMAAAEKEASAARTAASAAKIAADQQVLAADVAAKAAELAAARTVDAQAKAAAATGDAQGRAVAAAELAAAREAHAAGNAATAAQIAADKQVAANDAIRVSDEKTAAAAEASSKAKSSGGGGKVAMGAAGMAGGILAGGLAVAATEALKQASKYEQAMTLLQTAGGELASNMDTVKNGILNVATATGTSTEQLAEGMYTIEKAGYRGADGLNVLKQSAEGAKAENVDLATMTGAVTSMMTSYHMTAGQATSATNMLVAGAGAAKTTMQEYAGSLAAVLPVASAAGVGFDQIGGAIATLTQHGTSAQESTQELANTIRGLQAPNNVAINAMQSLGINVTDLTSNLGKRGLTGTLDIVTNAIASKLGPSGLVVIDTMKKSATATADLQTMLGKMPPALAKNAQSFLDGTMSMSAFQKSFKGMGASGDAQGKQFMTLAQTVKGYNDQIKAGGPAAQTATAALKAIMGGATGMNTALMLTGENMAGFKTRVQEVGAAGKKNGSDVSTWAKTQQELAVQTAKTAESFQTLAIKLGTTLAPAAKIVMGAIQGLFNFFSQHQTIAMVLAAGLGVLAIGLLVAAAAVWVMNSALLANPITWVIVGIVALIAAVVLLAANWGTVSAWIANVWGGFIKWCTSVINGFVGWWNGVWSGFASWITGIWNGIVNSIQGIIGGFLGWWGGIWSTLSAGVNSGLNAVREVIGSVLNFIGGIWNGFWNGPFGQLVIAIFRLIAVSIQYALMTIYVTVRSALQEIAAIWNTVWSAVSAFFTGVWNGIVNFLTPAMNMIHTVITNYLNMVFGVWSTIWNAVHGFLSGAWAAISGVVSSGVNTIWSFVSSGLNNIWSFFTSIWNSVVGFISGVWSSIIGAVSGGVGSVVGAVSNMGSQIMGAIGGIAGQALQAGANIVQSLAKGITNAVGAVTGAIGGVIKSITDMMPHSPAKKGPLSGKGYTLYSGQKLVEDLAVGMHAGIGSVTDAADTVAGAASGSGYGTMTAGARTAAGATASGGQSGAGNGGTVNYINVQAQTNADPNQIAAALGYKMLLQG